MLSRRGAISAMVGAAMLAMPVSAFASHQDHDFRGRPQAWHDQGEHRGWFKHDRDDDHFRGFRPAPRIRNFPPRVAYWNHEPDTGPPRHWRGITMNATATIIR